MKRLLSELIDLFYPRLCLICQQQLMANERHLCLHCLQQMPRTHYHRQPGNPVEQLFWGKVEIVSAQSYFFFLPEGHFRHLIHAIKYAGEADAAQYLGARYAAEIKADGKLSDIDYLIPVPLHPKRFRQRGYNQSEKIAHGVADIFHKPVLTKLLYRKYASETQTHKSVYDRWENMQGIFGIHEVELPLYSHLLLIDDVITTGATLTACAQEILQRYPTARISILSLAVAP